MDRPDPFVRRDGLETSLLRKNFNTHDSEQERNDLDDSRREGLGRGRLALFCERWGGKAHCALVQAERKSSVVEPKLLSADANSEILETHIAMSSASVILWAARVVYFSLQCVNVECYCTAYDRVL